jgi:CPA1 family monovalent cation:H+ antiporter
LQARAVVLALTGEALRRALWAAVLVTATIIVVRFVWIFPATYLPWLLRGKGKGEPPPNWRGPFFVAFTGLRGAVSLVAALLIPVSVAGIAFPDRDIVLFATYVVILVTLVGLGLALRPLVRVLGLMEAGEREFEANQRDERQVRLEALDEVLGKMGNASDPEAQALRRGYADRRERISRGNALAPDLDTAARCNRELHFIDVERAAVALSYEENRITDEARRRIERELDLEEARVRHALANTGTGGAAESS